jgi:hemerythrin
MVRPVQRAHPADGPAAPGRLPGLAEHERFIDQICGYQKQYIKGTTPVMINLFNDLWDWFAGHILLLDRRYMPFLRAQGCR